MVIPVGLARLSSPGRWHASSKGGTLGQMEDDDRMRILIAGCGYVGRATAKLFVAAGCSVEGWTRSAASAAELAKAGFPVRAVDASDAEAITRAGGEYEIIILSVSSGGGGADAYRRTYLESVRNLVRAFPRARLLFTSSTSVYAQSGGEWVTEASEAAPERETGRILREAEDLVLASGGVVARLAGIYGPGRSALLRKFLEGTAVLDPTSDRYVNQAHRDDIAAAMLLLARHSTGELGGERMRSSRIFNVSDHHPLSQRDCYGWLAEKIGRPMPPEVRVAAERKRGNSNKRVSSAKLQALGWTPRYPDFATGMTESILPNLERCGA